MFIRNNRCRMLEYIDISLVIIGESTDDDLYRRIMLEVSKADDTIVSMFHPIGANTIEVSAHWNRSEFDQKIESIKKIPGVKDIKILNQRKAVQRHNIECIKISEEASWTKESEPLVVITRAKDSRNYYEALCHVHSSNTLEKKFCYGILGKVEIQ
jgi:hypothetical protein